MTRIPLFFVFAATLSLGACKKQPPEMLVETAAPAPQPVPATVVQQLAANFARVHFAYDSATLDAQSRQALDANVAILQSNPDVRIEVQGHADERGTIDYNLALGARRARAVEDYMTKSGISSRRVTTLSLGEERPLDTGRSETAWSANRRAEFRILSGASELLHGTTTF